MTVTDETLMAIRMRIERASLDLIWQNPKTDDPRALRLVSRIERVARWVGPKKWEELNEWAALHFQKSPT